ncbi:MAG: Fe-S cluster assembly protein SufB [Candidatus Aenigmarchaeota archaeon]|nr:Fe-S cluster assembly protein SufB [Candidatus Aenigmarchaeota archaeon]
MKQITINKDYEKKYGFKMPEKPVHSTEPGLSKKVVNEISEIKNEKNENDWINKFRLRALDTFLKKKMPTWGADFSKINFDEIIYYMKSSEKSETKWEDVPKEIKETFDKLGIPQAERSFLAGLGAQYDSDSVYHSILKPLEEKGVIFTDPDTGLQKYPDIFKKYFGTIVPPEDNKFSALNSAVYSGGSFIYIPPGVDVQQPLQAYFRINAQRFGQFERTLIIADKGSKLHYIESCSAPIYSKDSLHAAVVEIVALPDSHVRYTTLQNWSNNVYNLVTKRAHAYENATVEWVDANLGSKITTKFPSVYLRGRNSKADILSVAFAGNGQHQDTGGKAIHLAPNTSSRITAKSVSKGSGRTTYRGLLYVGKGASNVKSTVRCDALLINNESRTDTYPYNEIHDDTATITHEATVGKIGEDMLFYLMSRGLSEQQALNMVVMGFFEPFAKEIPLEYALEFNRLIQLEMAGSVG